MESELLPAGGINGINLDNYFPNHRSYNSVVYYHKKLLTDNNEERKANLIRKEEKLNKPKCKESKKNKVVKQDKGQQFCGDTLKKSLKYETTETACINPVLGHTVQFNKNIVPLVFTPVKDMNSPVYYTIKTIKKHTKHDKKPRESSVERDITYNKEKNKKLECIHRRKRRKHKESCSARESIGHSSQNTLDDINININQSCSFSASTKMKYKRDHNNDKGTNENSQKFFISNSFEALATESMHGFDCNKIKIQLMNETDKNIFSESIKKPIINTVKDFLLQMNNPNDMIDVELKSVQKHIKNHNQKLDEILEKLASIEKKIDLHSKHSTKVEKSPRPRMAAKASKLEELGEDILEINEDKSAEEQDLSEEYNVLKKRAKARGKSVVVSLENDYKTGIEEKKKVSMGCGEEVPGPLDSTSSVNQLGIKPDRPNRLPARFCWTDADRKK